MLLVIFFVLSAVALLFFLVPLFARQADEMLLPREGVNTLLFKDRLLELENDRAIGKIDASQFEQLKLELEATLLADAQGEEVSPQAGRQVSRFAAVLLTVLIPLISVGLYRIEGQLQVVNEWLAVKQRWEPLILGSLQGRTVNPEDAKELSAGDYIRVMQSILQRTPEHVQGWQDLGLAYMQVGLPQYAETAFRRAVALVPGNTDLLLLIVESKLAQGRGALDNAGVMVLHQVLKADPSNPKARMMMGMVSFNGGDYDKAISLWQSLLNDTPVESEGAQILQSSIARAVAKRDEKTKSPSATTEGVTTTPGAPQLNVEVTVSKTLEPSITGPYWLMVYAKAVGGMPMPVAIEKSAYEHVPTTITLDDQDAMAPMAKLSTSKTVTVYARLSKSGSAMPQSGDFYVEGGPLEVKPETQVVRLEISQLVK